MAVPHITVLGTRNPSKRIATTLVFLMRLASMAVGFRSCTIRRLSVASSRERSTFLMTPLHVLSGAATYAATSNEPWFVCSFCTFTYDVALFWYGVEITMMFCILLGQIVSSRACSSVIWAAMMTALASRTRSTRATSNPPLGLIITLIWSLGRRGSLEADTTRCSAD